MIKMLLFSSMALLLLPGCGWFKKKPQPVELNRDNRLAGRVYKVDEVSQFVLIRRYGSWRVDESEVVVSRGEGRTANLLPTGERLGEHVAADIRSGSVAVGDGVYIRQITGVKSPQLSTDSDKPGKIDSQDTAAKKP